MGVVSEPAAADAVTALRSRVLEHRFPSGQVRVEAHEAWLGDDAMLAEHDPHGPLQPMWVLIAALRGMGTTIEELIRVADASPSDGVMFGEMSLEQTTPLESEVTYTVAGRITDLVRKGGKRTGPFDLLDFEVTLEDPQGQVAATLGCSFVLPRGAA